MQSCCSCADFHGYFAVEQTLRQLQMIQYAAAALAAASVLMLAAILGSSFVLRSCIPKVIPEQSFCGQFLIEKD